MEITLKVIIEMFASAHITHGRYSISADRQQISSLTGKNWEKSDNKLVDLTLDHNELMFVDNGMDITVSENIHFNEIKPQKVLVPALRYRTSNCCICEI